MEICTIVPRHFPISLNQDTLHFDLGCLIVQNTLGAIQVDTAPPVLIIIINSVLSGALMIVPKLITIK